MREPLDPLALWEVLGSTAGPGRGAALLVAGGFAPDLDSALDRPLAAAAACAADELAGRCASVGTTVETSVSCPECHELLEVPLDLQAFAATAREPVPPEIRVGDSVVRAPTTRDLLVALQDADPAGCLRRACVRRAGPAVDGAGASDDLAAASERLAGLAALAVRVDCPHCGEELRAEVDLVALLAEQVSDEAQRLLGDVAELAAAYGWTESEILGLSRARRRTYLDLARSARTGGGPGGARDG